MLRAQLKLSQLSAPSTNGYQSNLCKQTNANSDYWLVLLYFDVDNTTAIVDKKTCSGDIKKGGLCTVKQGNTVLSARVLKLVRLINNENTHVF